jgi:SpoVK/Ycf46/Vps4 family AAA+-type ATPase
METLDTSGRSATAEDILTVGQALSILCVDFNSQISHRKYFYQSSKLMTNAVISLSKSRWHVGTGDLTENRIVLDRRILDWVVGLDSEINELVEGSDLYEPAVNLSQVVLPLGYVDAILSQCRSYDEFQRYRLTSGLEKTLSYGNSLVILLCGKSGTGKTMTVNAIANELGKKVLLVDFNSLVNKKDNGSDLEVDLKGLFRESKMSNAVLFFDECEVVFKSRNLGSDRLLNSLLTEIERHEGIVFMATNRPYEIDEAMHRRITMVLEYKEPDYDMRKQIWDHLLGITPHHVSDAASEATRRRVAQENNAMNLLSESSQAKTANGGKKTKKQSAAKAAPLPVEVSPEVATAVKKGLSLHADVDTSVLAIKYELTGGFIKNAVLSSLLSALSRDKNFPVICQQDLVDGCKLQMRGNLTQRNFEDRVTNRGDLSLARMHLSKPHREAVNKIIRHEQARAKVYGSWNTSKEGDASSSSSSSKCEQRASIHLFAGTRGSGKNTLVKTIASELGGKKSKYIHVADFVSGSISDITHIFKTLVADARLMDAMVVVDGFEHVMEAEGGGDGGGGGSSAKMHLVLSRIMDILYQYHGCVFLLCHIENPQNVMLQRDFASRLLTFVRFTIPPHEIRSLLWQSLLPTCAPLANDINFEVLGRRFEMNAGSIRSSIANATAEVAMRTKDCSGMANCALC